MGWIVAANRVKQPGINEGIIKELNNNHLVDVDQGTWILCNISPIIIRKIYDYKKATEL